MNNKRIVFYHLLNDFSGSPMVLSLVIKGLVDRGYSVELYTSINRNGFLSNLQGVIYHNNFYNFTNSKFKTSFLLIISQIVNFISVFKYFFRREVIIYINTIYPFGATLGAFLIGKRIIYHVHENPVRKSIISRVALIIIKIFADRVIFVSNYLYNNSKIPVKKKELVYNSLSPDFIQNIQKKEQSNDKYNILMICSLRIFKGVLIFNEIAKQLPHYNFTLVVNGSEDDIKFFFKETFLSGNLEIFSSQTNVHPFYQNAHLVLNLSLPDMWVETFGLTILEAMSYGIPVIIPPVGGITELIDDGVQGYKVDARNTSKLVHSIKNIFSDKNHYMYLCNNAKERSQLFSYQIFLEKIEKIILSH